MKAATMAAEIGLRSRISLSERRPNPAIGSTAPIPTYNSGAAWDRLLSPSPRFFPHRGSWTGLHSPHEAATHSMRCLTPAALAARPHELKPRLRSGRISVRHRRAADASRYEKTARGRTFPTVRSSRDGGSVGLPDPARSAPGFTSLNSNRRSNRRSIPSVKALSGQPSMCEPGSQND